jgi:hypothetical protein
LLNKRLAARPRFLLLGALLPQFPLLGLYLSSKAKMPNLASARVAVLPVRPLLRESLLVRLLRANL